MYIVMLLLASPFFAHFDLDQGLFDTLLFTLFPFCLCLGDNIGDARLFLNDDLVKLVNSIGYFDLFSCRYIK